MKRNITLIGELMIALVIFLNLAMAGYSQEPTDTNPRINELKSNIKVTYDKKRDITFYEHKKQMGKSGGIGFYIAEKGGIAYLRFYAGTSSKATKYDSLLRLTTVVVIGDDFTVQIPVKPDEYYYQQNFAGFDAFYRTIVHFDEWIDTCIMTSNAMEYSQLLRIRDSSELTVLYLGKPTTQGKIAFTFENIQKDKYFQAMTDILDYYELVLGHKFPPPVPPELITMKDILKTYIVDEKDSNELKNIGDLGYVFDIALTKDSGTLALSCSDDTIKLYSLTTDSFIGSVECSHNQAVAFAANDSKLVATDVFGNVRFWNVDDLMLLNEVKGHEKVVNNIVVEQEKDEVITGSWDTSVKIWSAQTYGQKFAIPSCGEPVYSIAVNPANEMIASGDAKEPGNIKLWNDGSTKCARTLKGHKSCVSSLVFNQAGDKLISGSYDGTIVVWSIPDGKPLGTLRGHYGKVRTIALSPDNSRIASGGADGTIKFWDLNTYEQVSFILGHTKQINKLLFSYDGAQIFSAGDDNAVREWDVATGELLKYLPAIQPKTP